MALRVAIANGNWSNPSTWYLGVKPTVGDIAASNGYTVTIDENATVDTITNAAASPVSAVPIMTGYTTPSGIASASQEYSTPQYAAWKAFDGSTIDAANNWLNINGAFVSPQWIQYQFTSAKVIKLYSVQSIMGGFPTEWQFQGWNGSSWITLDSVTGGSSLATPLLRSITNEVAYTIYRLNVTAISNPSSYFSVSELKMFEFAVDSQSAVAGGGFIISTSVTVSATGSGIIPGPTTAVTFSGGSGVTATINALVRTSITTGGVTTVIKSGIGTLNINGNLQFASGGGRTMLGITASGTVNIVGNLLPTYQAYCIVISGGTNPVVNITGDINPNKSIGTSESAILVNVPSTLYVTGNLYGGNVSGACISLGSLGSTVYVTGNIYGGSSSGAGITSSGSSYINVVGTLFTTHTAGLETYAVLSTSSSAINLFSGPFICSSYGTFPYQCVRMHLIPSVGTYFEFRDETTNGALSPGAIAPATRLISPASLVDTLAVNNVRFGIVYALGALTGTLRMPTATQVTSGIPVDNTFGSAVLTIDAIWDYLVTNINTPDSIGMRLKNVSTPQTTGEQLEAFLRLD